MHLFLYLSIFFLKLLENALGTIRMIIATNGNKLLSSILQFFIGLVWVVSASLAIVDIRSDPIKILVFALASAFGSYAGCFVEEKIAIGKNVLFCITNLEKILKILTKEGYTYTVLLGSGLKENHYVILIALPRKKKKELIKKLKTMDPNIMIISEMLESVEGGTFKK